MATEAVVRAESGEGVTHQLCSWVNGLTLDDIPEDLKNRANYLMPDGFGCAIVGARLPWTEKAVSIVLDMEHCLVWGYVKKIGPLPAALLNSTEVQSFELDDWHSLAPVHANSIMLPALLAAASQQKARGNAAITGSNLLLSTIVGY
ncbi:hypothetical protein DTO271G3_8560 [Paecilomyces variotii]|nr:hypothetical protein DTO271G3_8560 [Paecilomyces variotii]